MSPHPKGRPAGVLPSGPKVRTNFCPAVHQSFFCGKAFSVHSTSVHRHEPFRAWLRTMRLFAVPHAWQQSPRSTPPVRPVASIVINKFTGSGCIPPCMPDGGSQSCKRAPLPLAGRLSVSVRAAATLETAKPKTDLMLIPGGKGNAVHLKKGDTIKIINTNGTQARTPSFRVHRGLQRAVPGPLPAAVQDDRRCACMA